MTFGLWIAVGIGGAAGAMLRQAVNLVAGRLLGTDYPWATQLVNVSGSFLMGLLVAVLLARMPAREDIRLLLGTGVLGAFTTFSTFSLDAVQLMERGAWGTALVYITGSVVLAILALMAGLMIGRGLA